MLSSRPPRFPLFVLGTAFLTVALGGVAAQSALPSDLKGRLAALLPDNGQSAQVMDIVRDPAIAALEKRLSQAIAQDPRWFDEYRRANINASELPWSAKLGLTRNEWVTLNKDSGKRFTRAQPPRTASVAWQRSGNRVTFTRGSGTENLGGITLDLVTGELRLPEGYSAKPYNVDVTIKNGVDKNGYVDAFGQSRRGLGWSINVMTSSTRFEARFYLLQLESGALVLSYDRTSLVRDQRLVTPKSTLMLMFDKRGATSKRSS